MDKGLVGLWYGWRVVIGNGDGDGCSGWLMVGLQSGSRMVNSRGDDGWWK